MHVEEQVVRVLPLQAVSDDAELIRDLLGEPATCILVVVYSLHQHKYAVLQLKQGIQHEHN